MKRLESKDRAFVAWVEVPDVWLAGHYAAYASAWWEASKVEKLPTALAMLAGVLVLASEGVIQFDVPGIKATTEAVDLSGVSAQAMAFLIQTVARPLEATQVVPFGPPGASGAGTTPTPKKS